MEAPLSTKLLESKLTCDMLQRIPRGPGLGASVSFLCRTGRWKGPIQRVMPQKPRPRVTAGVTRPKFTVLQWQWRLLY